MEEQRKTKKNLEDLHREWVNEWLQEQYWDEPNPYEALIRFSNGVLRNNDKTDQVEVWLLYSPYHDDEGNYAPEAGYEICTPVGDSRSFDGDPLHGDIFQLDRIYSGPPISRLLEKLGRQIAYTESYKVHFVVRYDTSNEAEIEKVYNEMDDVPFELYARCFSVAFPLLK